MHNTEEPRYHSEYLQYKWQAAVYWLRMYSKTGWVLDKKVEKK